MQNGCWMHSLRMMNASRMDDERTQNGCWTMQNNYWIQFWAQTQQNANECKRKGKLIQWKAEATEHKHIGTQTQRNANGNATEPYRQWTLTQQNVNAMERKTNAMQPFFSANATESKCKWCSMQMAFNANGMGTFFMTATVKQYGVIMELPHTVLQ